MQIPKVCVVKAKKLLLLYSGNWFEFNLELLATSTIYVL